MHCGCRRRLRAGRYVAAGCGMLCLSSRLIAGGASRPRGRGDRKILALYLCIKVWPKAGAAGSTLSTLPALSDLSSFILRI